MGRFDLADQRAFASGQPVFAVPDAAGLVKISGPDSVRLLSALTTLPPDRAPAPGGSEALLLDGHGHILFGLMVLAEGPDLLILTDGSPRALADVINSRRFRLQAEAAPQDEDLIVVTPSPMRASGQTGSTTGPAARLTAVDNWPHCGQQPEADQGPAGPSGPSLASRQIWPRYALARPHPGQSWAGLTIEAFTGSSIQSRLEQLDHLGYRQIDAASLEALRIAAWRPLATHEAADGKTLPHELDWLRTTTPMNSGCYPGQETVAKIINAGKPPRRLVFLHLDGSQAALPAAGAAVHANQSAVGHITSAGIHYEKGPIALALVKRSLSPEASLAVAVPQAAGGLIAAAQTVIVPVSGESDARPSRRPVPPKLALRQRG
ncbi:MAG: hypothetical protein LBJ02_08235 [Bifidobacteriaceae bacterium]|jgi:folate-binding protein YgfZ|nr:hypothetical protein [Bifidobacteriaceae bacterium]